MKKFTRTILLNNHYTGSLPLTSSFGSEPQDVSRFGLKSANVIITLIVEPLHTPVPSLPEGGEASACLSRQITYCSVHIICQF